MINQSPNKLADSDNLWAGVYFIDILECDSLESILSFSF